MKKAALIEFYRYHHECLYSQILFLENSGYEVVLFCDEKVKPVIDGFNLNIEILFFDFKKLSSLFRLRKILIRRKFDNVILNTAQGNIALKFCLLPFPKNMHFAGNIHNLKKLGRSRGQAFISRKIKNYYVLDEYILPATKSYPQFNFAAYYPAFFPSFNLIEFTDKNKDVWICIPGSIEYRRRDYDSLIDIASNCDDDVKFILLGNASRGDGTDFIEKIKAADVADKFVYFEKFVNNRSFYSYIHASDYLLPLIHPNTPSVEDYKQFKISGIFPLAKAFRKTMLLHDLFKDVSDFNYSCKYYNSNLELLNALSSEPLDKETQPADFNSNRKKYLSLLK